MSHSDELLKEISIIALQKEVYIELGYPIFSDINHTWYLAYDDNKLIGFCSSVIKKKYASFNHDYVLSDYRRNKVYNELFKLRLLDVQNILIKAVATKKSINTFIRYDFEIIKVTRNYIFVKK